MPARQLKYLVQIYVHNFFDEMSCFLAEYLLSGDDENALSLKNSGSMVNCPQGNRSVILIINISGFRLLKNLVSHKLWWLR